MSVPVTVKLSELFYRKLGHEVVDEMVNWFNQVDDTYRGQLRELNELNFARFDAKVEQRMTQLEANLEQRITHLDAKLEQGLAVVRAELRSEIAKSHGELQNALHAEGKTLIRWMFGFWIMAVVTLGGLVVGLLRFLPAARP